jgi:stage II sporulation protein D
MRMSLRQAGRKLGSFVKGSFRGIEVVRRGRSPRIVEADVIGTRGRTRVTGGQLRARFGLFDTWAFFTSITTGDEPAAEPDPVPAEDPGAPTGGTQPPFGSATLLGTRPVGAVSGRVLPVLRGQRVTLQRRAGARWVTVGSTGLHRGGRYSQAVTRPGTYRVRYHDETGPAVRVR